jgi:hypothetical protein
MQRRLRMLCMHPLVMVLVVALLLQEQRLLLQHALLLSVLGC